MCYVVNECVIIYEQFLAIHITLLKGAIFHTVCLVGKFDFFVDKISTTGSDSVSKLKHYQNYWKKSSKLLNNWV